MLSGSIDSLELQEERITAALHAVVQSETFRLAKRLRQLLQYLVTETLAGRGKRLKQFNIAVEAFGHHEDFHPQVQTSVRTEAWRLRSRLNLYYQNEGLNDEVRISLPKGGFMPVFELERKDNEPVALQPLARRGAAARLLILPFSGLSTHDSDIVTAFHDEISLSMAKLPGMTVLSRGSSESLGQTAEELSPVLRASEATYAMQGSLFRQGQTYRLTLQIIDSKQDVIVWSARREQHVEDVIAFQRQVAADVAASVQSWLRSKPPSITVEDDMAPRHVLRDNVLLREYLRGAIRDRTAGEQVALGLGCLASGHTGEATRMFSQAIMASPADGLPHTAMGLGYLQSGRLQDAFQAAERGVEFAPRSAFAHSSLAAICMHMRDFDGAIMFAQKSVALAPEFDAAQLLLGDCFLYAGLHKTAIAQLEEACRLADEHPVALAHLGYAYARSGKEVEARRLLRILQQGHPRPDGPNAAAMTLVHAGLEDLEQAFRCLDCALTSRNQMQELLLLTSPAYDDLRAHPGFNSFANRLNTS
ncbi:hypothetical protein [Variovorax ginsengisoli]|uniref:TolB-like protein/Tfp pilus assembly protein PilF n=1 Tax=Variovorax ginsengisoli TaxID=363844 RepID=A0ABT9S230_9BURK|nr:hypothetical protein [Variovorax ginsengisoli]MDP9898408.1 TolB-like protein/Tfp pilus assembly protein PilF [Variovorax ginsengisoli]